jgi:hypothetical protein
MINVCRMVRDQALTSFLRGVFGTKPGQRVVIDEGAAPIAPKPTPEKPVGWRAPDDVPAVKGRPPKTRPPAPKPPTEAGTGKPDLEQPAKPDDVRKTGPAPEKPTVKGAEPGADESAAPPKKTPETAGEAPAQPVATHMTPEPGESHVDAIKKLTVAQKEHPNEVGTISKDGKVVHTIEGAATEVAFPMTLCRQLPPPPAPFGEEPSHWNPDAPLSCCLFAGCL